jgi:hypothetical protein
MRHALVVGVLVLGAFGAGCGGSSGARAEPQIGRPNASARLGVGGGPPSVSGPAASGNGHEMPPAMLVGQPAHEVLVRHLSCGFGDGWEAALDDPPRTFRASHDIDQCHDLALAFAIPASEMHAMTDLAVEAVRKTVVELAAREGVSPAGRLAMGELVTRASAAIAEMQSADDTVSAVNEARAAGRIESSAAPSAAEAATLGADIELRKLDRFSLDAADARSAADAATLSAMIGLWRFGRGTRLPPGFRWAATRPIVSLQVLQGASANARSFHDLLVEAAQRASPGTGLALPNDLGKIDVREEEEHQAERTVFFTLCKNLRQHASDLGPSELRVAALGMAEAFEREKLGAPPREPRPVAQR